MSISAQLQRQRTVELGSLQSVLFFSSRAEGLVAQRGFPPISCAGHGQGLMIGSRVIWRRPRWIVCLRRSDACNRHSTGRRQCCQYQLHVRRIKRCYFRVHAAVLCPQWVYRCLYLVDVSTRVNACDLEMLTACTKYDSLLDPTQFHHPSAYGAWPSDKAACNFIPNGTPIGRYSPRESVLLGGSPKVPRYVPITNETAIVGSTVMQV
ncbi:hypothetical protein ACQKWADRAFT_220193 [Trichoderma austrokoningii]